MKSWFRSWLDGAASTRSLVVLALLMAAINFTMVQLSATDAIPDLLHPATPSTLLATLDAMGELGRTVYARNSWLDVLYPMIYSTLLSGALGRLRPRAPAWRALAVLPFVAALFDLGENAFLVGLTSGTLATSTPVLWAASAFNGLKWLCADVSLLAIAALALRKLLQPRADDGIA